MVSGMWFYVRFDDRWRRWIRPDGNGLYLLNYLIPRGGVAFIGFVAFIEFIAFVGFIVACGTKGRMPNTGN